MCEREKRSALGLPVLTELIENLSGFPGDRQAGHILECHPSGVGGIVPGHQVSSPVFSQNIDDDVMKQNGPLGIALDEIERIDGGTGFDNDSRFFKNLPLCRLPEGFPQPNASPRDCPQVFSGRPTPPYQEDPALMPDNRADGRHGIVWGIRHGYIAKRLMSPKSGAGDRRATVYGKRLKEIDLTAWITVLLTRPAAMPLGGPDLYVVLPIHGIIAETLPFSRKMLMAAMWEWDRAGGWISKKRKRQGIDVNGCPCIENAP